MGGVAIGTRALPLASRDRLRHERRHRPVSRLTLLPQEAPRELDELLGASDLDADLVLGEPGAEIGVADVTRVLPLDEEAVERAARETIPRAARFAVRRVPNM